MKNNNSLTVRHLAPCVMVAALAYSGSTFAADPPDFTLNFPGGAACAFALQIDGWGIPDVKQFTDKNGNVVREITAGKGSALRFTNTDDHLMFSTKSNGGAIHTAYNADGSFTTALTGHTVLILFPTDIPSGPSTTLHVGRVVYKSDAAYNFEVQSVSGKQTDICAAVSY